MAHNARKQTQPTDADRSPSRIRPARIEHVNLTVSDPERSAAMAQTLFGWRIRWRGAVGDGETIHVGDDHQYIAFYGDARSRAAPRRKKGMPLNHVAVMVDDLAAVEEAARSLGLQPFGHGDYAPGLRFYLFDWDGIEYEIVEAV